MSSLRANIARSPSEMDRIAPLWNNILQSQAHTIFQSFAWNRLAAHIFGDRGTPKVLWLESDVGAAIIPAVIDNATRQLELLGDALFDYRDVLHAGDREILRMAWQQLANYKMPLRVRALEQSAATERWPEFPISLFARAPRVDRSIIDEQGFRVAHSRLGRQMRRLEKLGVSFRRVPGANSAAVRHLYDCKRAHFAADTGNLFLDQRRCDFMVAAAALHESRCELFTLEAAGGTLVAGIVTFRDGDVRRCYTTYFHPDWAHYSPGVTLLFEVTARSLGEGLSCDYMTGEYPYKLRLANASRLLYNIDLSAQQLAQVAAGPISRVA